MRWRVITVLFAGVVLTFLGALWLLQGADLVHMRPVLCAANCEPMTGGSAKWLIAGIIALLAGLLAITAATRQLHHRAK